MATLAVPSGSVTDCGVTKYITPSTLGSCKTVSKANPNLSGLASPNTSTGLLTFAVSGKNSLNFALVASVNCAISRS